jgi:hypothetical protein
MKRCITIASFSPLINGRPCGTWIQPQCGVRQGCPLSQLVFNLAIDTLARNACRLLKAGIIRGYSISNRSALAPVLQYADDTVFFVEGNE